MTEYLCNLVIRRKDGTQETFNNVFDFMASESVSRSPIEMCKIQTASFKFENEGDFAGSFLRTQIEIMLGFKDYELAKNNVFTYAQMMAYLLKRAHKI